MEKIILKYYDRKEWVRIDEYIKDGGYSALKKVISEMTPEGVVEIIKASSLRGRGGAGFPTGRKWAFLKKDTFPRYLIVNSDESEPGTFKDRTIIRTNPHTLIEGILITLYAIRANVGFIYIRGELFEEYKILKEAISEAYEKGFIGRDVKIYVYRGAGAYICGEETALMESIEGRRGYPRIRPPFPAEVGLFGKPTIVNNVETISYIPVIISRGVKWYTSFGTLESAGLKLFCVSGDVKRCGVYEVPFGTRLIAIINEYAGGVTEGREIKAVFPGGTSSAVLGRNEFNVAMDFESLASKGSMLGSGGIIVIDDSRCMVDVALNVAKFYEYESCGQCTPCREGTGWVVKILRRIEHGEGKKEDIQTLLDAANNMRGITVCPFGDATAMPINSIVTKFRSEFEEHIEQKRCKFVNKL